MLATHAGDIISKLEIAHHVLEEFLKNQLEIDQGSHLDINMTQVLLLWRMSKHEERLSAGEVHRRCYDGSNVTYNLKLLREKGYIDCERSAADRRSIYISLTVRATDLTKKVTPIMDHIEKHVAKEFPKANFSEVIQWVEMIGHRLPAVPTGPLKKSA